MVENNKIGVDEPKQITETEFDRHERHERELKEALQAAEDVFFEDTANTEDPGTNGQTGRQLSTKGLLINEQRRLRSHYRESPGNFSATEKKESELKIRYILENPTTLTEHIIAQALPRWLKDEADGKKLWTREKLNELFKKYAEDRPELAFLQDPGFTDEEIIGWQELLPEAFTAIYEKIKKNPYVTGLAPKAPESMEELKAKYTVPAEEKIADDPYRGFTEAEVELLKNQAAMTIGQLENYLNTTPVESHALYIIINFLTEGGSREEVVNLVKQYYDTYKNFRALEFTKTFSDEYLKRNISKKSLATFEKELYKEIKAVTQEQAQIEELRKKFKS